MTKHTRNSLITVGALLLFTLMLGACAPAETEVPPTATSPPPPPPPTPIPDQSAYHAAAEGSRHGFYDLGIGPNTWCSRCHSPQNWDPEAFQGPPPACFTCKFAFDEELRIAEGNPFVPEEEWVGIPCETCHRVDANGIADAEIAWLNPVSGEYVEVNTPDELCDKCHVTTTGNAFGSAVTHRIEVGGSAHLYYGGYLADDEPPPVYCSDCHDSHDLEVVKQCVDCHVIDNATHANGKYVAMQDTLTCQACHDASGADVGPHPDEDMGGIWTTIESTPGRGGGPPSVSAILSHSIVWEVPCDRCHSKDNAYGLPTLDSSGDPLEETICADDETLTVLYDELDTYGEVDVDYTVGECPTEDE